MPRRDCRRQLIIDTWNHHFEDLGSLSEYQIDEWLGLQAGLTHLSQTEHPTPCIIRYLWAQLHDRNLPDTPLSRLLPSIFNQLPTQTVRHPVSFFWIRVHINHGLHSLLNPSEGSPISNQDPTSYRQTILDTWQRHFIEFGPLADSLVDTWVQHSLTIRNLGHWEYPVPCIIRYLWAYINQMPQPDTLLSGLVFQAIGRPPIDDRHPVSFFWIVASIHQCLHSLRARSNRLPAPTTTLEDEFFGRTHDHT